MLRKKVRKLLVIDDDRLLCDLILHYYGQKGIQVRVAHSGGDGVRCCQAEPMDVVLLDQKLPDGEGRDFCADILATNEQCKVIFITAFPSFENAVRGIKVGAHDYLSKPFELEELTLAIERALRTLDLEDVVQLQHYERRRDQGGTVLVNAGGLAESEDMALRAAASTAPMIITGETGTGKNVMAKYIHYQSDYRNGAFLSLNCAALPENLIEAELFGTEKGAFTGAEVARKGIFEMAEGGSLLLDEIGEMPLHLQAKLLSVLEDGCVRRLGGNRTIAVNVRIIAATNRDIEEAVRQREFREDLYFRLNVVRLHLPALRERKQDIPSLCGHFLGQIPNGKGYHLPEDELERLMAYAWPGNVRELKNVIERAVIFHQDGVIFPSQLLTTESPMVQQGCALGRDDQVLPLDDLIKNHVLRVLEKKSGNVTQTAKALDISLSTLKRKLKSYRQRGEVLPG